MTHCARLVVLISGHGSNLQAIMDACVKKELPAEVAAVVCNRPDAYGLTRTREAGLPCVTLPAQKGRSRSAYDQQLAEVVKAFHPDWVILAGWMRMLSLAFLDHFPNQVVNLHPALPGTFPGTHAIESAYQAWQAGQIRYTGVMVHLVNDEGMDDGPLLNQRAVAIEKGETLEKLEEKVHAVEHGLLVETIRSLIMDGLERTIQDAKSNSLCL